MADFALLDLPRDTPIADPDAYLHAALQWHFGADTGSEFWLRTAARLDFDPRTEITGFADLRKFPNVVDELRNVAVEDLIPRGYGSVVPQVFESGGTTGAPKRTVQLPDWAEQTIRWHVEDMLSGGYVRGGGWLGLMPSGPHGVGYYARLVAQRLGSTYFTVDLDPRWVKRLSPREVPGYVAHVLDQAGYQLRTQRIANLHTTPPLLNAIARVNSLVDLVNSQVRYLLLSGAHVDPDTLDLFADIFPETTFALAYGSTMIMSQAHTRRDGDSFVFDPRSPYVFFRVIDPDTGADVPYGERGQVVMNHISKGMFLPNNLERDTAIRVPGLDGQIGDSVSEVAPVAEFAGEPVVEGVY